MYFLQKDSPQTLDPDKSGGITSVKQIFRRRYKQQRASQGLINR